MTDDEPDSVLCDVHEWLEVGGATDEHTAEKYMRCAVCGAECIVETPQGLYDPTVGEPPDRGGSWPTRKMGVVGEPISPTRKVTDIRKARDQRAPKTKVYTPDSVQALIGVCPGPEQEPGEVPTHLLLRAPPGDGCGWALSAQQALELATWLAACARSVTGA